MQLLLIRHGKTEENERGAYIGTIDLPLSGKGEELCRKRQKEAKLFLPQAVFSSPMKRCVQTACILFGRAPEQIESFREYDFGVFEGKTYEQLKELDSYRLFIQSGGEFSPPGGESGADFERRVCGAFISLADKLLKERWERAAAVLHGGVIMRLLFRFAREKKGSMYGWQCGNCEGYRLVLNRDSWNKERRIDSIEEIRWGG